MNFNSRAKKILALVPSIITDTEPLVSSPEDFLTSVEPSGQAEEALSSSPLTREAGNLVQGLRNSSRCLEESNVLPPVTAIPLVCDGNPEEGLIQSPSNIECDIPQLGPEQLDGEYVLLYTEPDHNADEENACEITNGTRNTRYDPLEGTSAMYSVIADEVNPTLIRIKRTNHGVVVPSSSSDEDQDNDNDPNFSPSHEHHADCSDSSSSSLGTTPLEADSNAPSLENQAVEETMKKKGRKRARNSENWVTKKLKSLRNSGQKYVTYQKKTVVSARKIRPPCGTKCRLKCSGKISEQARQQLFSGFWSLADLQRQREFIATHNDQIKPKYRYSSTQDFRELNRAFYFDVDDVRMRVCKQFFMATLDINARTVKTALSKKSPSGFVEVDRRGRHDNHRTVDPEIKESVREFINAIPRVESHYLRAQTSREFIEGGKCLADLYRDYKENRDQNGLTAANAVMFNRIFNLEFNISFFKPKKDQCDICESYNNASSEETDQMKESFEQHKKETELSRAEKESDKRNPQGAIVAVYDLQAVMPVPRGLVSSFYYKSKLNCYNFTISDLHAKNVDCYFWNETEAKRGANEIGSCVYLYLKDLKEQHPGAELNVIFYSDNCCGQQKNKYLVSLYAHATQELDIKSITHKFLIRGHSQNEGDNVHSVIEKQISRHLRASPIYIPDQYVTLIQASKKSGPPYKVHVLTYEAFYDLKALADDFGNNFNQNTDKSTVNWHDIKIIRVEREHENAFFYKTSYQEEEFKKIETRRTKKTRSGKSQLPPKGRQLVNAYSGKIPLADNKKRDIKDLAQRRIIPQFYYDCFFKNILDL